MPIFIFTDFYCKKEKDKNPSLSVFLLQLISSQEQVSTLTLAAVIHQPQQEHPS